MKYLKSFFISFLTPKEMLEYTQFGIPVEGMPVGETYLNGFWEQILCAWPLQFVKDLFLGLLILILSEIFAIGSEVIGLEFLFRFFQLGSLGFVFGFFLLRSIFFPVFVFFEVLIIKWSIAVYAYWYNDELTMDEIHKKAELIVSNSLGSYVYVLIPFVGSFVQTLAFFGSNYIGIKDLFNLPKPMAAVIAFSPLFFAVIFSSLWKMFDVWY